MSKYKECWLLKWTNEYTGFKLHVTSDGWILINEYGTEGELLNHISIPPIVAKKLKKELIN